MIITTKQRDGDWNDNLTQIDKLFPNWENGLDLLLNLMLAEQIYLSNIQ